MAAMKVWVTGAGFIGSALMRYLMREVRTDVRDPGRLTYVGNQVAEAIPVEVHWYHNDAKWHAGLVVNAWAYCKHD